MRDGGGSTKKFVALPPIGDYRPEVDRSRRRAVPLWPTAPPPALEGSPMPLSASVDVLRASADSGAFPTGGMGRGDLNADRAMEGLAVGRSRRVKKLLWVLPLVVVGCSAPEGERRFVEVAFDTVFVFGGPADTVLNRMSAMRAFLDGVVATDNDTGRVAFISGEGDLRWIYERRGRGPFEINRPWDVVESAAGTLYVLDANNLKVVELSSEGEPIREERIPTLPSIPWGLVEIRAGELLLMDARGRGVRWWPWKEGAPHEPLVPLPYPDSLPPGGLMRQIIISPVTEDGVWVAGMLFGPRWWINRDGRPAEVYDFVHRPGYRRTGEMIDIGGGMQIMNTPPQTSYYGAEAIAVELEEIWVLSGGGLGVVGESGGSLVDVYGLDSGDYRYSFRTPTGASGFYTARLARRGNRVYLMYEDPALSILALDIRDPAGSRGRPERGVVLRSTGRGSTRGTGEGS